MKQVSICIFFIFIFAGDLLFPVVVPAQETNYFFRNLTVEKGLSHTDATSIVQGSQGFIWIGTFGGLQRFDGHELRSFINDSDQLNTVYNNRIFQMVTGQSGHIWIASEGGLKCFDTITENYVIFKSENAKDLKQLYNLCYAVFAATDGSIYFLTDDGFFQYRIEKGIVIKAIKLAPASPLPNPIDGDIVADRKGNIWVNTGSGLLFVNKASRMGQPNALYYNLVDENGVERSAIGSLLLDNKDRLLVGSVNGILNFNLTDFYATLPPKTVTVDYVPIGGNEMRQLSKNKNIQINNVVQDLSGNYWLGSDAGLIQMNWNSKTPPVFRWYINSEFDNNSLTFNHISSLFLDNSGSLWITTWGGGVNYVDLNQKQFSLLRRDLSNPQNTLSDNYIRAMVEDQQGNLWIGTRSGGLNCYNFKTKQYTQYKHISDDPNSLNSDNIRSLAIDRENRIWIGTDQGINIFRPEDNSFESLVNDREDINSLSDNVIFSIAVDYFGQIWAGSWANGLNKITYFGRGNYRIERFFQDDNSAYSLCSNKITFIYADTLRPEVFVSTNKGLNHIYLSSRGKVAEISCYTGFEGKDDGLSSNYIWPVVRTDDSTVWAGTLGGGINKILLNSQGHKGYKSSYYSLNEGAPSNDMESLLVDNNGNLWLGSKGLSMFDTKENIFINYDHNDGLQGDSFKIGASCKGRDSRLYFGGTNGISYFYPDSIKQNSIKPKIVFTELVIQGTKIEPGKKYDGHLILAKTINNIAHLKLKYFHNNFSIAFAALLYANPEKSHFKYLLEGYDEDWIHTDRKKSRTATYANLAYGDYTFKVMGSNHDSYWNAEPLTLKVSILPPWWETQTSKVIYGMLFLVFMLGIFYWQRRWFKLKRDLEITLLEEKKMEEMHQMRMQFFTNISHEFRTPLTLILGPIEKLRSEVMERIDLHKYYNIIYNNANRLHSLINELMDFRKVESGAFDLKVLKDDISRFVKEIGEGFSELAVQKDISFKISTPQNNMDKIWFDKKVVEKILINLISNAFRYTKATGAIYLEVFEDMSNFKPLFKNEFKIIYNSETDKFVWIHIVDNGVGITSDSLPQIFERYYRISNAKDRHLGSGVGLALVKSLVGLHKGNIFVYSERDKGTEFFVALPKESSAFSGHEMINKDYFTQDNNLKLPNRLDKVKVREFTHRHDTNQEIPTVLLVEDNDEVRDFLKDGLKQEFRIIEAINGLEGLEKTRDQYPDLIISDIMMPVMDGVAFCEEVKHDLTICHIPFILLTARSSVESRIKGTESGADAYFSKPFNLKLLKASVWNIVENRRKIKERYTNDTFIEVRELVTNKKDKDFIDRLIEIIEANMENPKFDIDHLCMEVGNSRTKLYNKVKGITGQSVGEFIRRLRMKKSARYLLTEDISVAEAMARVGIQSQSYFTKTFKKEFGTTPAQYVSKKLSESNKIDAAMDEL